VIASPDGRNGSVTIHADAIVYAGLFAEGESTALVLDAGRHAWVHVAEGEVRLGGHLLGAGDGASVSGEREVRIEGVKNGEVLVFDLA